MHPLRLLFAVLVCALSFSGPGRASAQDDGPSFRAALRAGTCAEQGDRIARLATPMVPTGDAEGASAGEPALVSATAVDIPLADLLDGKTVLVVTRQGARGVAACGAVGGPLTEADILAIQVAAVGDAGVWGVAVLAPDTDDPDRTAVTLYLVGEALADTRATAGQAPPGRDVPVGATNPTMAMNRATRHRRRRRPTSARPTATP